ncbi:DUF4870 domain-containing protein [Roseiflexus sp.]|uniref:DUF4870 domain-containing protein n=1 Tax=Roseiflexus sp. TaxID=2562120 RepID=UPI0021DEF5FC|nr:DUF4870 domain-containing protein [Roseiflexus sp.]GIW00423.1 MAG: hypothetical protein KatS3mg058_1826 [Roseiflexus sp.]
MARPDEDERLTAAMAHASMIANATGLTGLALTVVLWATQRRRSRFVRAHIVQALVYQAGTLLGVVLLMLLWSGCLVLSLLPAALRPDLYRDGTLPDTFWIALFGLIVPIVYGFAATLYALYGAYQVYRGNRFAYPLAGRLVARDLEAASSDAPVSATLQSGTPSLPSPGSPLVAQPSTPAPPTTPQARVVEESAKPDTSAALATAAAPPSSSEAATTVGSAGSAPSSSDSAPPISGAHEVAEGTPVQDALDQGSRLPDRVAASPADAPSTGQAPDER